ncbi:cell wall-binding repeat-containing protein [Isachenkonia alkalipeptolytica]|nr:cell wall-binding repeat-containing protein [Isachenkonia alkalipeptolytica]
MRKQKALRIILVTVFILCIVTTLSFAAEEKIKDLHSSDYELFVEQEPNNTTAQANLVDDYFNGEKKYQIRGTITNYYFDMDYFRFEVPVSGTIKADAFWSAGSNAWNRGWEDDLAISLRDSSGDIIVWSRAVGTGSSKMQRLSEEIEPGTYYIHIMQSSNYRYLYVNEAYALFVELEPSEDTEQNVAVNSVSLNKSNTTLLKGGSKTLRATISPSNATNQNVTWSSSDESVATVNSNGRVQGVGEGTATITVRTDDGGKRASADVIVEKDRVSTGNVNRLSGLNRYSTAGDIANEYFKDGVDTVILARGDHENDTPQITSALVSASLTGEMDVPILLTIRDRVPNATFDALDELRPRNILIIGDESEVSASVERELEMEYSTTRIYGRNLNETAKEIALHTGRSRDTAYVVQADALPDALAIGSVASATGNPILLTDKNTVPSATLDAINALGVEDIYIIGGTAVISDSVEEELNAVVDGSVNRVAGLNRFETSVEIGKTFWNDAEAVTIANGVSMVDAVASSILQRPLILVRHNRIVGSAQEEIKRYSSYTIIGGETVVENGLIENAIE